MNKILFGVYIFIWILTVIYTVYTAFKNKKKFKELSSEGQNIRYSKDANIFILMGVFSLLIIAPFFYIERNKIPDIFIENPATSMYILFLLIGSGFLLYGIRLHIKNKKILKNLIIEVEDISAGGKLKGKIVYKGLHIKERKPVKVNLILQKVYVISNREMELGEKAVWSQEVESHPYTFKDYVEVPFEFNIKDDFPKNWEEGYELVLAVQGENVGVDTFVLKSEGKAVENIEFDELFEEPITKDAKTSMELIAQKRKQNVLINLLSIIFVIYIPASFWIFLIYQGTPLKKVQEIIFYNLFSGVIFISVFYLPIYFFAKSFTEANVEEKKKKLKIFKIFVYGIVVFSFLFSGFLIFEFLKGNSKVTNFIFDEGIKYMINGFLGGIFILGVYSLISYIRALITGDQNVY